MASLCRRQVCTNEKRGVRQDWDSWRRKLIHRLGVERILEVLLGARIFDDLKLFKDYKPASVSNWSFDENCLFCCLRREKVKDHVVALNNKIVESGGKPLLGKDPSNIIRLECQVEEFLNAVLHRREYTPRIPDPHIPVVACDTIQQMIGQLVHYTPSNNSQGLSPHNGKTDQSLLKTPSVTSLAAAATATASAHNPVLSNLLMADQDAPLDLSVKKVKTEIREQDGVLDLSIKKNRSQDISSPRTPHKIVARDSVDPSVSKVKDLQSVSTLEQFMAKLCLHHQRQIVDAFGFLQTEVNSVASFNTFQLSCPVVSEKATSSSCRPAFEERPKGQKPQGTLTLSEAVDKSGDQEPLFVKNKESATTEKPLKSDEPLIAPVRTGPPIDITNVGTGDEILSFSKVVTVEHKSTDVQPKCPTLLIVKNRDSGNLEAKNVTEEDSTVQLSNTGTHEQDLCTPVKNINVNSCDPDDDNLSVLTQTAPKCHTLQISPPAQSKDSSVRPCLTQRTSNVFSAISPRTARKSKRKSLTRQRVSPVCQVINDPDVNCDIVYIGKPITECELQSQNRMLPRRNARKSTRGHVYIGDCLEVKTVRTLARKSAVNGSGNCIVPMPVMNTSVTPKQALAKPDGVPPMDVPFTGDCMETVLNKTIPDQSVDSEMPGDIVEFASEDLVVEPSQTGQLLSKDLSSPACENEQSATNVQQDLNVGIIDSIAENSELETVQEKAVESDVANNENIVKVDFAPASSEISEGTGAEIQEQNKNSEASLALESLDTLEEEASVEHMEIGKKLKDQNVITDDFQSEASDERDCLEMQVMACTDTNAEAHITCSTETQLKPEDAAKFTQDVVVEEMTKEQPESSKESLPVVNSVESISPKKVAKPVVSSDRCLRSRVSKCGSEQVNVADAPAQTKSTNSQIDVQEKTSKNQEPKPLLKTQKLKPTEENLPSENGQHNLNATEDMDLDKTQKSPVKPSDSVGLENTISPRSKQRSSMIKEAEVSKKHTDLEFSTPKEDDLPEDVSAPHGNPETVEATPQARDEPPEKNIPSKSVEVPERMPLRNRSNQVQPPPSKVSSPIKTEAHSSERMPLRSRNSNAVDQPVSGDVCISPNRGQSEGQTRMPLRNRNVVEKDSCISPSRSSSENVSRMPLRSKNNSTTEQHIGNVPDSSKDASSSHVEQSVKEDTSIKSSKMESPGRMPLRSGNVTIVEEPSNNTLPAGNALESPGRMSLRSCSSVTDQSEHSSPPSKSKTFPQRPQRTSKSSVPSSVLEGEQSPKTKSNKPKDNFKDLSLSASSVIPTALPPMENVSPSPSKFLKALNGVENQQLISDLNSKFDKMQKGWVQMDKEGPPAPRPKNRADRLKEIWKSKKRIRKPRSEQQKFSPVQMLFMKSFDLPSICRWFLHSTETKSLVIVKKVNTRLPSETQLCFHNSASIPGSSNGVFPSLQAERLKKHLKKFAIASPVKSNAKNKRLIAKALAQNISAAKSKEKQKPSTATRISTKRQSCTALLQMPNSESQSKVSASAKNPASARILRKYSNMREKMQVQQNTLKYLESSLAETNKIHAIPKNVSKAKLSTGKGQNSAIVRKVKALAQKAKAKSVIKERAEKRSVHRTLRVSKNKDATPSKEELKASKFNPTTKSPGKKEPLVKTEKSSPTKMDVKKSPLPKTLENLESLSQITDIRPLLSEDQVLTRSQRKIEATFTNSGSPKSVTKRGIEPLVTSAKRTRTSK